MFGLGRLLFRLALLGLPARFRAKHGREMVELYAEALAEARRRGFLHGLLATVAGPLDVAAEALRVRTRPQARRAQHPFIELTYSMLHDLKLALRSLLRSPGYSVIAVLTLGLGIGASSSVFSLVNAVLFRAPAHVQAAEELVAIGTSDFSGGAPYGMSSLPDFYDFREQPALADAVAFMPGIVSVVGEDGVSEIFIAEFVTGNYFEMFGVQPMLGRAFTAEEGDHTSGEAVAILSHGLWTRRFAADPAVIGSTMRASGQTLTIVGVAPEGYGGAVPLITPDLWLPPSTHALIQGAALFDARGGRGWFVQGRLAPGATVELAQEQLTALAGRLQEQYPNQWTDINDETRRVGVVGDVRVPAQFKAALQGFAALLLVAVLIVLLIACANVANLTIARAAQRNREVSLKAALGAGRLRVVRQLLAESSLVAAAGAVIGGLFTVFVMRTAETVRPLTGVSVSLDLGFDARVLLFGVGVTSLTVLAIGLLPALRASRTDLAGALRDETLKGGGRFRWYELRHLLVVGQVAASMVLLVGAGLFLKGLQSAVDVDPGFDVEGIATVTMALGPEGYTAEEAGALFEQLEDRIARLPGVEATSVVDALPMTLSAGRRTGVTIPGYEPSDGEDMEFQFFSVSPGFVDALGMELLAGRDFSAVDVDGAAQSVLVNETFAGRFWPGEPAVGQLVNWSGEDAQVVGLVKDAMYRDLQDIARPAFFIPLAQNPGTQLSLLASTTPGSEEELLGRIRAEVTAIDTRLPIATLQTMEDAIAFTLLPQRIASWLLSITGAIGMLLAAIGLYGVMSFLVSQRTREVGVRMALGAGQRAVVRMVVRRALSLAVLGTAIGLGLAATVTRFTESLLFEVSPLDPIVFAAMGAAALVVAGVASWLPAHRAATIDPMVALRHE